MLSQMEKAELMNRTKALRDDELEHILKYIPTRSLLDEIGRRESVIVDTLTNVCQIWDINTKDKSFYDMDILEKEDLLKQVRRVAYYGE